MRGSPARPGLGRHGEGQGRGARARLREMLDLEVGDFAVAAPPSPVGHAAPDA